MTRFLAGLVCVMLAAGTAAAADFGVPRPPLAGPHAGVLPECSAPDVIARIVGKFAYQDARLIGSGVAVAGVDNARQKKLAAGGPSLVDVRYCTARALLSNGRTSEVVYIIEGPQKGKYSFGYAVESCLPAYDPYRVYGNGCRSIRG
jgi:hypothetical protein